MIEKYLIERLVESAYDSAKEYGSVFVDNLLSELNTDEIELLDGFHPNEVHIVNKDDDYFCSARANTFVVMFGWDEKSGFERSILIQANHKGLMHFLMFAY